MYESPALLAAFAAVYSAVAGLLFGLQRVASQIGIGAGTGLVLTAAAFALLLGGSTNRECLGNVVVLEERHLRRIPGDYFARHHRY